MTSSQKHTTNPSIIDPESGAEMARLFDLERLLTTGMGGLLPEQADLSTTVDVLDIGCGPGGWVHQMTQTYPEMEVTGIDLSQAMIDYARAHAFVRLLPNAHFHLMDATQRLSFPDASFDLVNACLISGFLLPHQWFPLLMECKRILREGGIIRLTEGEWGIITDAPAVARFFALGLDALYRSGRSFSPDGRYHAITAMLPSLLRDAGFQQIQYRATAIDHSFGASAHESFVQNYQFLFSLGQPFILQQELATKEELDILYQQAMNEMHSDTFGAMVYLLCAWGKSVNEEKKQCRQEER
jgi:SAM-dependent methyltransferase